MLSQLANNYSPALRERILCPLTHLFNLFYKAWYISEGYLGSMNFENLEILMSIVGLTLGLDLVEWVVTTSEKLDLNLGKQRQIGRIGHGR